ncbi:OmpA/MotB [Cyanobium sp. NIES-981]|nr:OmpA/MotB [Cyanobium sp. NIES-981]
MREPWSRSPSSAAGGDDALRGWRRPPSPRVQGGRGEGVRGDLDRWVSAGRQLVDGVSGARPGSRASGGRGAGGLPRLNDLGRWVEGKLDWILDDEDDWRESWEEPPARAERGPTRRSDPAAAAAPSPSPSPRRPLEARSRRGGGGGSRGGARDQGLAPPAGPLLSPWTVLVPVERNGRRRTASPCPVGAVPVTPGRRLPKPRAARTRGAQARQGPPLRSAGPAPAHGRCPAPAGAARAD